MSKEQWAKRRPQIMKLTLTMAADIEKLEWNKDKFGACVNNEFIGHLGFIYEELKFGKVTSDELKKFDRELSSYPYVYDIANKFIYKVRFHYVSHWRKHNYKQIYPVIFKYFAVVEEVYIFTFSILNKLFKLKKS